MTWIDKTVRFPTPADADVYGCILAWHMFGGIHLTTVNNFAQYGSFYTHWAPTPEGPEAKHAD